MMKKISKMKKSKLARGLKIGVVGATGMVGKSFMLTLEQQQFPVEMLRPFASESSLGKTVQLNGKSYPLEVLKPNCFAGLDLVFFSSGDDISKEWAPQAVQSGAWAIDNSNAFRMNAETLLVVPEVNGDLLDRAQSPQVIANPNCSTIQLVVALQPLKRSFGLREVRLSSYQAVSGAGQPGYDELLLQTQAAVQNRTPDDPKAFPHFIFSNCIPQIGSFTEDGYCTEEVKIMNETRKILRQNDLRVSAFTVRVPVLNAHAEAVWVTLEQEISREQIIQALTKAEGIVVQDQPQKSEYPLQSQVSGQDPVFVGRIHQDRFDKKTWLMWVVSDNVRKGAALNGIQIAQRLFLQ
jgi:aspartate-semialdehyde dehydrogenase